MKNATESMDQKNKQRKQIAFDIDTRVAESILGKGYNSIYANMRKFLEKMGFEHIQGSVYVTKEPAETIDIINILKRLKREYPYLDKCIRSIKETDVGDYKSLDDLFHHDGTPGIYINYHMRKDGLPTDFKEAGKALGISDEELEKTQELIKKIKDAERSSQSEQRNAISKETEPQITNEEQEYELD